MTPTTTATFSSPSSSIPWYHTVNHPVPAPFPFSLFSLSNNSTPSWYTNTVFPYNSLFLSLSLLHPRSRKTHNSKMLDSSYLPQFLQALLREKFFNACIIHEDSKKNEKNIFCLDCCHSICTHCLDTHGSHRLLQIRRYIYHDVIRVGDAEKLMDCAYVQSYITNNAKVVFLNKRALTRPCRGTGNPCITCDRGVQDSYLYCSLFCKLQYLLKSNCSLSKYIFECESMTLPEQGFDDGAHMTLTPESVLEIQMGSLRTSSGSSGSGFAVGEGFGCTATTETVVRKKRSSMSSGYRAACRPVFSPVSENSAGLMNRRKGTPHRSPLY